LEDLIIPTITPSKVPSKAPGTLFSSFVGGDPSLNIRWLTAADPAFYEALNRPIADIAVRQLVIAKAVDRLQLSLGKDNLFPFLVEPIVVSGTQEDNLPVKWIWDLHASLPKKWNNLRLTKIKRMSGANSTTSGFAGILRLIFAASAQDSTVEVSIFSADYRIDSDLTYQTQRLTIVDNIEESNSINPGESETVSGFITFRTLDINDQDVADFIDMLAPPASTSDTNGDGLFDQPSVYEVADSVAGGIAVTEDYNVTSINHGTGMLLDSAWNAIPSLDSDTQAWVLAFNYPFDSDSNLLSVDNIRIPQGLFREFNITAPAGDNPTGDGSGLNFPVWVSRIERIGSGTNTLRFYFSTYNVTDTNPNTTPIEFATMDLLRSYGSGQIVQILPNKNLKLINDDLFDQHFGRGHAVLSSIWDGSSTIVDDFFNYFAAITISPADTEFTRSSTRISSFGASRIPKYVPTKGQSQAMLGSAARLAVPRYPSVDNRYVTEEDQGLGNQIDLEAIEGITPNTAIDRFGFTGSLTHKICKLNVSADNLGDNPATYEQDILPRLRILLGRDPKFGDFWYNGTRLMFNNGDSWQG